MAADDILTSQDMEADDILTSQDTEIHFPNNHKICQVEISLTITKNGLILIKQRYPYHHNRLLRE